MSNGPYQTEDEVIRGAMDAPDRREQDGLIWWEERNRIAIQQSRESLSKPLDDKVVLARLRERLARAGIADRRDS